MQVHARKKSKPLEAAAGATTSGTNSTNSDMDGSSRGSIASRRAETIVQSQNAGLLLAFAVAVWILYHMGTAKQLPLPNTTTDSDGSTTTTSDITAAVTIAYAVSLIKCGDGKQNAAEGLTEAALVLRHSIHHISKHNPQSGSRYDYKLYALVHRQAASCSQPLQDAGYEIRVVDSPVTVADIQSDYLRTSIHKEVCCGADEFIKLHAYALPELISVHVDLDFLFLKPMDDLFDAILFEQDSLRGKAARQRIATQLDSASHQSQQSSSQLQQLPPVIDALLVRDWFSTFPGRPSPYQAGFIVARRKPQVVQECAAIVHTHNYTEGFGRDNGWGSLGYGGFIGARAMQGLLAYYYDVMHPHTHVELNPCRYNHQGTHFWAGNKKGCKTGNTRLHGTQADCPDCRKTPFDEIYSIHYTNCRKPWNCVAQAVAGGRTPGASFGDALDTNSVHVEHCLQAAKVWHQHRADLEQRIRQHIPTSVMESEGTYRPDYFLGHCSDEKTYLRMKLFHDTHARVYDDIYESEYNEPETKYLP